MQRLWCLRGESPGCSLVRARRRTCRLSRNEINVQGAGLELRHVKLSHRCFSSSLPQYRPETKGNAVSPHIETVKGKSGERRRARQKGPFVLVCALQGEVLSFACTMSPKRRYVAARLLLHATEIASAHFPRIQRLFRSRSLAKHPLPCFPRPRRFVFPTPAAWLHLALQSCIKQTFALTRRSWRRGSISRTRTRMHYMCSGVWLGTR